MAENVTRKRWRTWSWGVLSVLSAGVLAADASAQTCGFGAGGTLTGVVNTYYPGVGTAAVNATSITVDRSARHGNAATIATGDMLLVIQMQDAEIDNSNDNTYGNGSTGSGVTALNNSGRFEYVVATSSDPGTGTNVAISIVGGSASNGLINSYTTATEDSGGTPARGQRTFQVVRVPRYGSATLSSTLMGTANAANAGWNGRSGGILAIDVSGTLTLGGTVSLDGYGFRGAPGEQLAGESGLSNADYVRSYGTDAHGVKGEGIAGTPASLAGVPGGGGSGYPGGDRARGAPGNGGGGGTDGHPSGSPANDQNTGGGGGANGGNGGRGGSAWPGTTSCPPTQGAVSGGLGGTAVTPAINRVILGGGGGAGTRNNNGPSGGGNGGGIVLIRAGLVSATGTITARGLRPLSTANDGGGGGGAGGTIVVLSATGNLGGLTVNAQGGGGGYANLPSPPAPDAPPAGIGGSHHGPGGGGGGGSILLSSAPASVANVVDGGVSGQTNSCPGDSVPQAYDAVNGSVGVIQTNLTLASVPGVQPCTVATRASIRGLRVNPRGTVEFATGSQRGTLAFNIYAPADARGQGKMVRLNRSPITAPAPSSMQPVLYRVDTPPITASYLLIEEIEAGGHRRILGPFPVGDAALETAFERIEARVTDEEVQERAGARLLTGRRLGGDSSRVSGEAALRAASSDQRGGPPRPLGLGQTVPGLKIEVMQAGPVRVSFADLVAHGLPETLGPASLRLTNLGRPVPFRVTADGGGLSWLTFSAESLSTDYTGRNVYVLTWGSTAAPAPTVTLTRSGFPLVHPMTRVDPNLLYAPFVPEGADPWVWSLLVAGQEAGPYDFDFPSRGRQGGPSPVRVRVGVVGGSDHVHTVSASINGFSLGRVTFAGKVPAVVEGMLPAGGLRQTGNELRLVYTAQIPHGDEVGLVFLDMLDVGAPPPASRPPVSVTRLTRYDSSMPAGGGDYLILTHASFMDHAREIAALKQAEGFRPWVVDVESAYDRYSAGVFEARAIQAFIRDAFQRSGVRYVLLVGGDSYDPRDFSGMGHVSFLPSIDAWDGQFGRVPSENKYADVDGDGRPDVAIGRLPVTTAEEADTLVDKIGRQSQVVSDAMTRGSTHIFAVDNQGGDDLSFLGEAMRTAGLLPEGSQVTLADVAQGIVPARQALLTGLNGGPLATHYFGHGGFDVWADEGLLMSSDVAGLPADERETILFTWTCETQWYRQRPGINEALLLHPKGGALAAFGPSGITDPALQISVYPRLYQHFFAGETLGEAVRRAKAEALAGSTAARPVVEGWNLLGDPALRLDSGLLPQ